MSIGPWQVIIVLVIILILFGAGKLPRVMGDLAKGVKNFKKGLNEEDREAAIESKPAETVAATESEKDTAART
ncbi:MAG: twin-arginine translocase TatA/TatE family subunit [Alphaproteobacteria bacterium]|nr:twin-arginine translocase TatA/TatE family subunit [Alphaproteobacteria bacterium]